MRNTNKQKVFEFTVEKKHKNFFDGTAIDIDKVHVKLSGGNSKIGKIVNINLLAGDSVLSTKDGVLTNVTGTCNGCCDGCKNVCYAVKMEQRFNNTCVKTHATNTILAKTDVNRYFNEISAALSRMRNPINAVRYHSSGEIPSYEYLLGMVETAKKHPNIKFYFYTKRFAWIERYIKTMGSFPENLVCNISEWHGNSRKYHLKGLNKFVYDDGHNPAYKNMFHCPAVKPNGTRTSVTCQQCKRCFSKNDGHITCVYSH